MNTLRDFAVYQPIGDYHQSMHSSLCLAALLGLFVSACIAPPAVLAPAHDLSGTADASVADLSSTHGDMSSAGKDLATAGKDLATAGDMLTCRSECTVKYPAGYALFEGYELKECGCAKGSVCVTDCTVECANPNTLTMNSPCGTCLAAQANQGASSACTVEAAAVDCFANPTCAAFVECGENCP